MNWTYTTLKYQICSIIRGCCHETQRRVTRLGFPPSKLIEYLPEKFVEIAMLHVLKDHDERVTIHTHTIELHNVIMLKIGQQLCLTLEILSGSESRILKSLKEEK